MASRAGSTPEGIEEDAFLEACGHHPGGEVVLLGEGLQAIAILHELDAQHQAPPADLRHVGVTLELAQARAEFPAHGLGPGH